MWSDSLRIESEYYYMIYDYMTADDEFN
jgi:hypothetical protein